MGNKKILLTKVYFSFTSLRLFSIINFYLEKKKIHSFQKLTKSCCQKMEKWKKGLKSVTNLFYSRLSGESIANCSSTTTVAAANINNTQHFLLIFLNPNYGSINHFCKNESFCDCCMDSLLNHALINDQIFTLILILHDILFLNKLHISLIC